jgi:hypothetical protein
MTPDLRASTVRFEPPLPNWLKVLYLGMAFSTVVTFVVFGLSVRAHRLCRQQVRAEQAEIAAARATIARVDTALNGQQAAKLLQDNLGAWRAGYAPVTVLEAALLVATVETRDAVIQAERSAPAKARPNLRGDGAKPRAKETPFLLLRTLSVEYAAGGQPVLHAELAHNGDSRAVVTQFSNMLSRYAPPNYQFNFRPVERPNTVVIDTTWRLQ